MAVADGDILRVRTKISKGNDQYMNVFHLECAFGTDQAEEDVYDAIADWLDDAYDELDGLMNDGYDFDTIEVVNTTAETVVGEEAWPTLTAGLSATSDLPRQCAPVVRFITNTLGSQGRKFLMGLTEDSNQGSGDLTTALTTALAAYAAKVLVGVDLGGGSTMYPGNFSVDLARFVPWVSAVVNDFFGTQRRRVVGVGT